MTTKTKAYNKVQTLVGVSLLAAIIVVLQTFASAIHIGPLTITLSLVPIVIGAIIYGPVSGALLGVVFGAVVCFGVISGTDVGAALMFQVNPFLTLFLCIIKSTIAGLVAGYVYQAASKKSLKLGVVSSAVVCPICNTGIFCLIVLTCFNDLVTQWALEAGQTSAMSYVLLGMVGVNFIRELVIDIVLVPIMIRIIKIVSKG